MRGNAVLVLAFIAAVAGTTILTQPAGQVSAATPAGSDGAGPTAPDFALVNQDGQRVTLHQFRGKFVLMNFIYTHCTDVCPLTELKLAKVQEDLKARRWFGSQVVFMSMTFDPKRDTASVLKTYSKRFRADLAGWHFLTGTPAAVDKVLEAYKIPVRAVSKKDLFDHALPMLVIDRQGVLLGHYDPDFSPPSVTRDLSQLLSN